MNISTVLRILSQIISIFILYCIVFCNEAVARLTIDVFYFVRRYKDNVKTYKIFECLALSTKYNAFMGYCVASEQHVGYLANQLNQMYVS